MITLFFLVIVFVFFWVLVLSDIVNTAQANYVTVTSATGVEKFIILNWEMFIFFALIIATMAYGTLRGR